MTISNITVATYNILDPRLAKKHRGALPKELRSSTSWEARHKSIQRNIENSKADILCLQECSSSAFINLAISLRKTLSPAIRIPHGSNDGPAIFYNPNKFSLLKTTYLHHENSDRVTVFANLLDLTTGKTIRVASLHILGKHFRPIGNYQLEEALSVQDLRPADVFIAAGDFNEDLKKRGFRARSLLRRGYKIYQPKHPTEVGKKQRAFDGFAVKILRSTCSLKTVSVARTIGKKFPVASDHRLVAGTLSLRCTHVKKYKGNRLLNIISQNFSSFLLYMNHFVHRAVAKLFSKPQQL
jgi:endonuclease/exonuclease/phosphatase family metal-dependent hydrolase